MKILKNVSKMVTGRPELTIGAVVLVTMIMMGIILTVPAADLQGEDAWIPGDEAVDARDDIDEKFSQSHNVIVLVHENSPDKDLDIISTDCFIGMLELESSLREDDVISGNLSQDGIISLPRLLAPLAFPEAGNHSSLVSSYGNMTNSELRSVFNDSLEIPDLGALIHILTSSENGGQYRSALMMVTVDKTILPGETSEDRDDRIERIERRIDKVVSERKYSSVRPFALTNTKINDTMEEGWDYTMNTLFPIAFGMIIVVLWITFRTISDLMIGLLALVFSLIWIQGFMIYMGYTSEAATIVPILLIGLGVDYSIHLTMRYRERIAQGDTVRKAADISIVSAGAALLLAAFTSMIGFLSNGTSDIGPIREFGITVAVGILAAYIVFVTFVPACRVLIDTYRVKKGKDLLSPSNKDRASGIGTRNPISVGFTKAMGFGGKIAGSHPKWTLTAATAITLILLVLATMVSTTFNFVEAGLPEGSEVRDEFEYMQTEFDFSEESVIIYVEGENVATTEVLEAMDATHTNIENDDREIILFQGGNGVESPLTVMRDLANVSTVSDGDLYDPDFEAMYRAEDLDDDNVPDSNVSVLFEYITENHPGELDNVLYFDEDSGKYTVALIRIRVDSQGHSKTDEIISYIEDDAAPLERLESKSTVNRVILTGEPVIMNLVLGAINDSMLTSIIITVVVSSVVLSLVFWNSVKSKSLGIITTLPVILVLIWIHGTMFLLDISLNVMTLLIGSLSIGLGVTYAIHVTHRFTEELEDHGRIEKAVITTVSHTGTALFGAAVTTMVGFGILALSPQGMMQQFGTLTALMILYSLLASVFIQPSILVVWARTTAKGRRIHPLARKKIARTRSSSRRQRSGNRKKYNK